MRESFADLSILEFSYTIRRGRLTREYSLMIVRKLVGDFPWQYLGESLLGILGPLIMTYNELIANCEDLTNCEIFNRDNSCAIHKIAKKF